MILIFCGAGVSPAFLGTVEIRQKIAGETPAPQFGSWNRQQRLIGWAHVLVERIQ